MRRTALLAVLLSLPLRAAPLDRACHLLEMRRLDECVQACQGPFADAETRFAALALECQVRVEQGHFELAGPLLQRLEATPRQGFSAPTLRRFYLDRARVLGGRAVLPNLLAAREGTAGAVRVEVLAQGSLLLEDLEARREWLEEASREALELRLSPAQAAFLARARASLSQADNQGAAAIAPLQAAATLYRQSGNPRREAAAQLALARVAENLGQVEAAQRMRRQLLERARRDRDVLALRELSRANVSLAIWGKSDPGVVREARQAVLTALAAVPPGERAELWVLLYRLDQDGLFDRPAARRDLDQAMRVARSSGDRRGELAALGSYWRLGQHDEQPTREGLALARQLGTFDQDWLLFDKSPADLEQGWGDLLLPDYAAARTHYEAAVALAQGALRQAMQLQLFLARSVENHDPESGRQLVTRLLNLLDSSPEPDFPVTIVRMLMAIALGGGGQADRLAGCPNTPSAQAMEVLGPALDDLHQRQRLERALDAAEPLLRRSAWSTVNLLKARADLYRLTDRRPEALEAARQALTVAQQSQRSSLELPVHETLATLWAELHQDGEAAREWQAAVELASHLDSGSAREARWLDGAELALARARLGDLAGAEEALQQSLALGGQTNPLLLLVEGQVARARGEWSRSQGALQKALEHYGAGNPYGLSARAQLAETEQAAGQLEAARASLRAVLEDRSKDERAVRLRERVGPAPVRTTTLADGRSQLLAALNTLRRDAPQLDTRARELLAAQKGLASDTLLLELVPLEHSLCLLTVSRERVGLREVRLEQARLRELVSGLRQRWAHRLDDRETARRLATLLLEPLRAELLAHPRLEVLPEGRLWYLPLEALPWPAEKPLLEGWQVSYRQDLAGPGGAAGDRLVAIGAGDLPAARREVEAICRVFPGAREGRTRADLVELAPQADILHLATHSEPRPDDPNASFLELADGPLTLADVYSLKLPPGALVVLSSCQSALGEAHPGREPASLASAFRSAGAASVIASLWRVDDEVTAGLMESFYRHLREGAGRGEALRQARLELAQHAEPYFWAPFVLYGEP